MENNVNPRWKLSTVLLNDKNYIPWLRVVALSLGGKKKLGFINGTFACPNSLDPKYER